MVKLARHGDVELDYMALNGQTRPARRISGQAVARRDDSHLPQGKWHSWLWIQLNSLDRLIAGLGREILSA